MPEPLRVQLFTDVLCFFAYAADVRFEKIVEDFGDQVAIRSTVEVESAFRLVFKQNAVRSLLEGVVAHALKRAEICRSQARLAPSLMEMEDLVEQAEIAEADAARHAELLSA